MLFLALGCVGQVSGRAPSGRPFLICRWSLEESVNAQGNRSARRSEAECSELSFLRGQTTSVVDQKSTSPSDYFALAAFSERGYDVSNCDVPSCGCGIAACGCSDCSWLDRLLSGDSWLTLDAAYRNEVFSNTRGGLNTMDATRYTGRVDALLTADLGCFLTGGVFVIHFQSLHGEGITDQHVGAQQRISNIDGNPGSGFDMTQVSQYFWQRGFVDGLVTVKLGKILADSEFAGTTLAGDYINASFGWTHSLPLAAYPDPTAGVVTHVQLTDATGLKIGVFDGAPDGRNWGFSGTGDVETLFELRRQHDWRCMPGDIHVGLWYHNGSFANQGGGGNLAGNHGVYCGLSQQLTRECCDDDQGLGTFVHFGWAPEDRNRVEKFLGGGLIYRGLLCGRDNDTIGVGVGTVLFSDDLVAPLGDETIFELFYKARIGERLVVQPDFQYFSNPGGQYPDSVVLGMRFEMTL